MADIQTAFNSEEYAFRDVQVVMLGRPIIGEDGFLLAGLVKSYQAKIKTAIDAGMTTPGEISRCRVIMDAKQNLLSTSKVKVKLKITPKGYGKEIEVTLGFENPFLS